MKKNGFYDTWDLGDRIHVYLPDMIRDGLKSSQSSGIFTKI